MTLAGQSSFVALDRFVYGGGGKPEGQLLWHAKRNEEEEAVGLTKKMASSLETQFFQQSHSDSMTSNFMRIFVRALRNENQYAYASLCKHDFVLYTYARYISVEEFCQVRFRAGVQKPTTAEDHIWWLDRKFRPKSPDHPQESTSVISSHLLFSSSCFPTTD